MGALLPAALRADDETSTLKLLTAIASRLSDSNAPGVLEVFAAKMPGYDSVAASVAAVTAQYDVICTIEIREESGGATSRKAETEWFLQFRSKQDEGPTERRTKKVLISTERIRGKWRITAMEPQSILEPPQVR